MVFSCAVVDAGCSGSGPRPATEDFGRGLAVVHFPIANALELPTVEHVLIDASIEPDKDMQNLLEKYK